MTFMDIINILDIQVFSEVTILFVIIIALAITVVILDIIKKKKK